MKQTIRWHSPRLEQDMSLVRWGHFGTPVLLFPTAGGDSGEVERFGLVEALGARLAAGQNKVYSCDSMAGRAWLTGEQSPQHCAWLQNQYDGCVFHEIVPAIRADCGSGDVEIITAGASIGAFNALASLCRHPQVFRAAVCMSGSYDLERYLHGHFDDNFYYSSPWHYLPALQEGAQLAALRRRFAVLAFGGGRWEDPGQSWHMAEVLGAQGVPNRVDPWDERYDHDWPAWREMLPRYLAELG